MHLCTAFLATLSLLHLISSFGAAVAVTGPNQNADRTQRNHNNRRRGDGPRCLPGRFGCYSAPLPTQTEGPPFTPVETDIHLEPVRGSRPQLNDPNRVDCAPLDWLPASVAAIGFWGLPDDTQDDILATPEGGQALAIAIAHGLDTCTNTIKVARIDPPILNTDGIYRRRIARLVISGGFVKNFRPKICDKSSPMYTGFDAQLSELMSRVDTSFVGMQEGIDDPDTQLNMQHFCN